MSLIKFSGLASGIDSSALIKSLLDSQRKARIDPLQSQVDTLTDTNSSLDKLKELLEKLHDAADSFRVVNGGLLSKGALSSNESAVTATATNSATPGTYSVGVSQLAKTANFSFNDRFTSDGNAINSSINNGASAASRTISTSTGTGSDLETISVVLTSSTSLSSFVSSYNAQATKSTASVVNTGTSAVPQYALLIQSNNSGLSKGQLSVNVGSEITSAGSGAFSSTTLSQATDAQFTLSGVSGTITRASNQINDVLPGVTFAFQATGSSTVTVANDTSTASESLNNFVEAYNDIIQYVRENDGITEDGSGPNRKIIFGALSGTSVDNGILSSLRSAFSTSLSGGSLNTLADLGIKTQRDGTLLLDEATLTSALTSDPDRVNLITQTLGDRLGGVDGTIAQYTRFQGLIDLTENGNKSQISGINRRISDAEDSLSRQESQLSSQYARLESLIGRINSQQSALAGLPK